MKTISVGKSKTKKHFIQVVKTRSELISVVLTSVKKELVIELFEVKMNNFGGRRSILKGKFCVIYYLDLILTALGFAVITEFLNLNH